MVWCSVSKHPVPGPAVSCGAGNVLTLLGWLRLLTGSWKGRKVVYLTVKSAHRQLLCPLCVPPLLLVLGPSMGWK